MIVGLCGGTGSGKTTAAQNLLTRNRDKVALVYLDDYCKTADQVPSLHGFTNWDSPESIDFTTLARDLSSLENGQSIEVMTKNELDNPDYWSASKKIGNQELKGRRIPLTIEPRQLILLEGFLILSQEVIRDMITFSIFMDLDRVSRMQRRTKFSDPNYERDVLIPMEESYVLASAKYADMVLPLKNKNLVMVVDEIRKLIYEKTSINLT